MEGIWYLTPLSTTCQLYRASQFYWCHWWMKPEYTEKNTDLSVHLTMSRIQTHNISGDRQYLTPLSTICQLFRASQFYWWMKPECTEKNTDLSVHLTMSRIQTHNVSGDSQCRLNAWARWAVARGPRPC